jgi:uncharacterized membrane protein
MGQTRTPSLDENALEASIVIRCLVERVFKFYEDFRNLPHFLGDVEEIEQVDAATSRWTIQGPLGIQARWKVRTTGERRNEYIRYETIAPPGLKTEWEIWFAPGPIAGETTVREVMKTPLGRLGRLALAFIGKYPAKEMSANLRRLKELMETGQVTDTRYAVSGKFAEHAGALDPSP